jgi:hypothetical protein
LEIIVSTKVCSHCHIEKSISEFYKSDDIHYRTCCKKCINEKDKNNLARKLYHHEWYLKNKQKVIEQQKKYRDNNIERIREYQKQYDKLHKRKRVYILTEARKLYVKSHREYYTQKQREWRENNIDSTKNISLKSKYGISLKEYNEMFSNQGGNCAICGRNGLVLCIDHNHVSKKVRGLICKSCNMALGFVSDDIVILENMLGYLEKESRL